MTLDDLRKIAEAATPGEWVRDGISVLGAREEHDLNTGPARLATMMMPWERERMEANAEFIATFNPARVLELLDQIEQLQAAVRDQHDNCTYQTRLAAVEQLHYISYAGDTQVCEECYTVWPCDTIKAVRGE